jgi:hypothetical protein
MIPPGCGWRGNHHDIQACLPRLERHHIVRVTSLYDPLTDTGVVDP